MAVSEYTSVKSGYTYYAGPHNFNGESYHEYREHNALVIAQIMRGYGWKDNVIAGIFGNMQVESSFNPGAYYGFSEYSSVSMGLAQWDPTSKYEEWADENGYSPYIDIEYQCERIKYESENGLQWVRRSSFDNMTFPEFLASEESPEFLAKVFVASYEIPAKWINGGTDREEVYAERAEKAAYWYEIITGSPYPDTPGTSSIKNKMSLPVFLAATRRRYVVR